MRYANSDAFTGDNVELVKSWTARELADKLHSGSPDDDGVVLRVVAARIAQRVEQSSNPGGLLSDLARAVASVTLATRDLAQREGFDQDDDQETVAIVWSAVDKLDGAAGDLYAMQHWC